MRDQGRHEEAAVLLRQNLSMSSRYFSGIDLKVLMDRDSLSDCLREIGDYKEAIKLDEVTLPIRQKIDHEAEDTIATTQSLAYNLSQIGEREKAILLYRSAVDTRTKTQGPIHPDTLDTKHNLASTLNDCGQAAEASNINAQILKAREKQLPANDDDLIATRHNLAANHYALGKIEEAARLTNQNLRALRGTRASTDGQLRAVTGLRDRIELTVRVAKWKDQTLIAADQEVKTASGEHIRERSDATMHHVRSGAAATETAATRNMPQDKAKFANLRDAEASDTSKPKANELTAKVNAGSPRHNQNVVSENKDPPMVPKQHGKAPTATTETGLGAKFETKASNKEDKASARVEASNEKVGPKTTKAAAVLKIRRSNPEINSPRPNLSSGGMNRSTVVGHSTIGFDIKTQSIGRAIKPCVPQSTTKHSKEEHDATTKADGRVVERCKSANDDPRRLKRNESRTDQTAAASNLTIRHRPSTVSSSQRDPGTTSSDAGPGRHSTQALGKELSEAQNLNANRPQVSHTASETLAKQGGT